MSDPVNGISLGRFYNATVKLRPATKLAHPELVPFDGERSGFLACWLFEREGLPNRGELAFIHPRWPIQFIASGDVVDAVVTDEDPSDV